MLMLMLLCVTYLILYHLLTPFRVLELTHGLLLCFVFSLSPLRYVILIRSRALPQKLQCMKLIVPSPQISLAPTVMLFTMQ